MEGKENEKKGNEVTYLKDTVNSVKVIRGQRGSYGWEIKVYKDDLSVAVNEIKEIDGKLVKLFGGEK